MGRVETTPEYSAKRLTEEYLSQNNISIPDYGFVFDWETNDLRFTLDYIIITYPFTCYIVGAIYVFLIFYIRRLMNNREAVNLRYFALFWNVFLACLNGFAFMRILMYTVHVLASRGFFVSICSDRDFLYGPVVSLWLVLFPFMKILELGDTIILVLQKRILHTYFWCHHLLALLGSWYIYPSYPSLALWLTMIVNVSHIPVYIYAGIHFFKVTFWKAIPLFLTITEMLSVLIGAVVSLFPIYYQSKGENCHISMTTNVVITVVFLINCVLCGLFLYKKLFSSRKKT